MNTTTSTMHWPRSQLLELVVSNSNHTYSHHEVVFMFLQTIYFVLVCSSSSSVSTKYDPDLLKSDVAMAKNRVSRLKSELEQIRNEMTYTQRGVDTLTK